LLIAKELKMLDAGALANFRESAATPTTPARPAPPPARPASSADLMTHDRAVTMRASQDRLGLAQAERKLTLDGGALPDEILAA
jgi:hypothetical protein